MIVFPLVGVYLTVMCVPYTQVFRKWGGGGGGLTRVSIKFDSLKKISHPWVCHEKSSQRALMVAYM